MIRVFDFVCPNGHRTEHFVPGYVVGLACPVCTALAERVISAPRCKLDGTTGDFPGAAAAWEQKRAQHMAKEQKTMRDHGEYANGRPCNG